VHVQVDRRGDELQVHPGERAGRSSFVRVHEHLEPEAEAIGVELVVPAGRARPPQVLVEDAHQLVGCRQRHDGSGFLEPAVPHECEQDGRVESSHDAREIFRLEDLQGEIVGPARAKASCHSRPPPAQDRRRACSRKFLFSRDLWKISVALLGLFCYRVSGGEESRSFFFPRSQNRVAWSNSHSGARATAMIRKMSSGEFRLYSRKKDPKTGRRRNLGTFKTRAAAQKHERAVQYFKRAG
jgi:hypothetical protein